MELAVLARIEADVLAYARVKSTYTRFAEYIAHIVKECCDKSIIHTVEHRSKDLGSFEKKCKKEYKDGDRKGALIYNDPLAEITDFAGVRVIVFVKEYVDAVLDQIRNVLDFVSPPEDVGDRVYSQKGFGYQSKHVLVKLREDRRNLKGNLEFQELVCEIQIRTILQHAWAEIEHDIQYKSEEEIPLSLRKKFSALAGLLEIGDNEFQSIEREGRTLREAVKSESVDELTRKLHQHDREVGASPGEQAEVKNTDVVRELIKDERYAEAVDLFTQKIAYEPMSLTLYVGRARVRFLLGDVTGALQDLDKADELGGGDTFHTERLRAIIKNGDSPRTAVEPFTRSAEYAEGQERAKAALSEGDGTRALDEYVNLEQSGWSRPFSRYGKALACAMESDIRQARYYLSLLQIRPSTMMAVNILALLCILDVIESGSAQSSTGSLREMLTYTPEYTLQASPLKSFFEGVEKRGEAYCEEVNKIRDILVHRAL